VRYPVRRRRAASADEIGERSIESVGKEEQVFQVGDALRVLPPVDGPVVAADSLAELDLSEAGVIPGGADACPDFPPAGE
jgi:hypothetical protein